VAKRLSLKTVSLQLRTRKPFDILRKHPANGIDFIEVKEPESEPVPEVPEEEEEEEEPEQIKRPGEGEKR